MCFLLFSLVMRTAYQSKQFDFMLRDMRPHDVETIEEMIENNFTFYVQDMEVNPYEKMDFYERFLIS